MRWLNTQKWKLSPSNLMTRIPEGEAGSFFKHLTAECGRSNLPKQNLHSDLPGILSSGDFKSTGFERFLFSSYIPSLLTEILCVKLQSCLGLGLRAISVFCFLPDPWDSEEVQGTVNRKWYLKYGAVTLKCFVDSNSSKDLEKKKSPVCSANRTLPAGSSWLPAHRTSPSNYSVGRNSTKFSKKFF